MKTKTCTKCKISKSITEFNKNITKKDGLASQCKDCRKIENKKYTIENVTNIKIQKKKHYEENKEYILKRNKIYRDSHKEERKIYVESNKEKIKKRTKEYKIKNKIRIVKVSKIYQQKHKEKIKIQHKIYIELNKDKISKQKKKYNTLHKNEIKEYDQAYRKSHKIQINRNKRRRKKTDINYKILENLRCRLWHALKKNIKSNTTKKLLGCTIPELKKHLQNQFLPGMTWKNHSIKGWHIDHIRPCDSFDLTKPSQQKKCFNYKNLQPLWAKVNYKKGNKHTAPTTSKEK